MKRNWSVVKLLGYVILGIGAITLVNANIKTTQANQPEPVTETTKLYNRSRHTITLTINQLDELKVTEGQRINVGDIMGSHYLGELELSWHHQARTILVILATLGVFGVKMRKKEKR